MIAVPHGILVALQQQKTCAVAGDHAVCALVKGVTATGVRHDAGGTHLFHSATVDLCQLCTAHQHPVCLMEPKLPNRLVHACQSGRTCTGQREIRSTQIQIISNISGSHRRKISGKSKAVPLRLSQLIVGIALRNNDTADASPKCRERIAGIQNCLGCMCQRKTCFRAHGTSLTVGDLEKAVVKHRQILHSCQLQRIRYCFACKLLSGIAHVSYRNFFSHQIPVQLFPRFRLRKLEAHPDHCNFFLHVLSSFLIRFQCANGIASFSSISRI